ncbi:hypothetical protein HELRODRAFT_173852 [Helobdella robusta]|uniref:Uncharacterized protein n=1 Tax=Helobdella robusta TaxID=6412 RepID=T1F7B2_HELRO|nr:hypothetical protein HELRODRAFT_173852 [Helobdella robusta]ESO03007.1 hypothetical protein HELRODRAFT_173852 [Helobdella robusta]
MFIEQVASLQMIAMRTMMINYTHHRDCSTRLIGCGFIQVTSWLQVGCKLVASWLQVRCKLVAIIIIIIITCYSDKFALTIDHSENNVLRVVWSSTHHASKELLPD